MIQKMHNSLSTTEQLLVESGDERIALDPLRGVNRYGCKPRPDPGLLDFASATASVISKDAFQAADHLRRRLENDLRHFSPETVYTIELSNIRKELLALCELGDLPKPDVIFAASGTDLHRISAQLSQAVSAQPILAIMVDERETGSGVYAAIAGTHPVIEVATVALRHADGTPRTTQEIDTEFTDLAHRAYAAGRHVLLIQADISKTGMIAPSYECTATLQETLGSQLDVLIDACQFRMSPSTLRACLARGYTVALTGSKFVGGPSFSGALLIPAQTSARYRQRPFLGRLASDATATDWPNGWPMQGAQDVPSKFGLLLRWKAALFELRSFRALPDGDIARFLQIFAKSIQERITNDRAFLPVPVTKLDRSALHAQSGWDEIQTIFPFQLCQLNPAGRRALDAHEMRNVYLHLPTAVVRCQLGQPVNYGKGQHALRLCLSARLIVQAVINNGVYANSIIAQAQAALDQAARLANPDSYSMPYPETITSDAASSTVQHDHAAHG